MSKYDIVIKNIKEYTVTIDAIDQECAEERFYDPDFRSSSHHERSYKVVIGPILCSEELATIIA